MTPTPAFELYREALFDAPVLAHGSKAARVTHWGRQLVAGAIDLLYPAHCMACGQSLEGAAALCEPCATKVQWIGHDCCRRCGAGVGAHRGRVDRCPECASRPPAYIESTCAAAKYGGPLRAVILGLKFGGGLQAVPLLGRLLTTRLRATHLLEDAVNWAVAPVPLARHDLAQRGFNQAEELARAIAHTFALRVEPALLQKVRATQPQATLDHTARAENLRGLFSVNTKRVARYRASGVLLIDDVMTTGATLSECARTLHNAGIQHIRAAVIARG